MAFTDRGLERMRMENGIKSKAPVKASKEQRVKVPRMVMGSDQPWPQVTRRFPVRGRRSVDRGRAGLATELRNHLIRVADLVIGVKGNTVRRANASSAPEPRSQRTGACTQTLLTEIGRSQA